MKVPLAVGLFTLSALTGHGLIMAVALAAAAVSHSAYQQSARERNDRISRERRAAHKEQEAADAVVLRLTEAHAKAEAERAAIYAKAAHAQKFARESAANHAVYKRLYAEHAAAADAVMMAQRLLAAARHTASGLTGVLESGPQVTDLDGDTHKLKTAGIAVATVLCPAVALYASVDASRPST